ncbi:MAG: hypothetical protein GY783_02935 [Gammaproteobacteria bacterium]|nr:hypothetical protein [Gammaproteobacteria bacterium]
MSSWSDIVRCAVLCGLALLVAVPIAADEPLRKTIRKQLRDESYMLIEDQDGARLFIFSTGNVSAVTTQQPEDGPGRQLDEALEMTRSTDPRTRVRGLTLLSDVEDPAALDAALVLLSDPVAAVREEAVQLIIEHPDADIDGVVAIAANDPSERVRQATVDLIEERLDDRGD